MPLNCKNFDGRSGLAFRENLNYTQPRLYQGSHRPVRAQRSRRLLNALIISFGLSGAVAVAEDVQLRPDHPDRYTVVRGDTLWHIATRFLETPWHWPRIWRINEGIKNPHLIYPGDVILLRYVDGKPELSVLRNEKLDVEPGTDPTEVVVGETGEVETTRTTTTSPIRTGVRLKPRAYESGLDDAIPTISPDMILAFLTQPRLVGARELDRAGYVTIGLDDRIALGTNSEFYARGLKKDDAEAEYFQIFRKGPALKNPRTGEVLAYEATYLGDAQLLEFGDPSKLIITSVKQEILPTDRLLAVSADDQVLPYYFPRAPEKKVRGYIVSALNAVAEIGSYNVVAITLGERDGIEEGHVLRVMRSVGKHKDPVKRSNYDLPDEESALVLVFRTFEKASYALVLNATRPVHLKDAVVTP
jgi:hypothetical protein